MALRNMIVKIQHALNANSPLEMMLTIAAIDMVGQQLGKHKIRDFFYDYIQKK